MEIFSLNHPSSLIQCVPTNITWTGGTAPYSLQINWGSSSTTIRQFNDILSTNFVWDTDVAAGTPVSLQVLDARTAQLTLDPIVVGAGPNSTCVQDTASLLPPTLSLSATPISRSFTYTHFYSPSVVSIPTTALFPYPSFTPTAASQTPPASSPSPIWYTDRQTTSQRASLSGASTAGLAIGLVSLLTFVVWLWSRYQQSRIRKRNNDGEKQDVADGPDKFEAAIALWGDDESTTTSEDHQAEDVPAPNPSNETPNAPSEDRTLIPPPTAPVPVPEGQPLANIDIPPEPTQQNTPRLFSSRRTKRLQRPRLFPTAQSDAGTVSDTGAARLSSSTASGSTSTAPPSYRTRQSSVYVVPPPLPPPAYTPADLLPPPLGFGIPRRTRRGWLSTSSKLGQGWGDAPASRGTEESSRVLGTESRAESPGASEERIAGITFSDAKGGPRDEPQGDSRRLTSADTTDSVSETGAPIRSADRED